MPTEDPDAAARGGFIQPLGGYKGYGLSLLLDVLTGVLSGGGFSTHVRTLYQDLANPSQVAHAFGALRIGAFMPEAEFGQRMEAMIRLMHSCPTAPGAARIYVPGEIEHETEQQRRAEGIPLNATLREELEALAKELGAPPPF
jgi:LDH2 family malate/lactate/ureidoglycolate dehydrogenase